MKSVQIFYFIALVQYFNLFARLGLGRFHPQLCKKETEQKHGESNPGLLGFQSSMLPLSYAGYCDKWGVF